MKKSSDLCRLPVIALREGGEIGIVRELVVDARNSTVAALLIQDRDWFRNPKAIVYSAIKALGDDAVMVESRGDLKSIAQTDELHPLLEEQVRVLGARCISTEGRYMGKISEFLLDTITGKITDVEITSPSSSQKPILVPASSIVTLTTDLVILQEREQVPLRQDARPTEKAQTSLGVSVGARATRGNQPDKQLAAQDEDPAQMERGEGGVRKILEERQDAYLLGKEVRRDVTADDGRVIIKAGEAISPEIIERAKEADKYLALSFSIRRA